MMAIQPVCLLPRREVERRTGLTKWAIYDAMREGTFPRPRRIGAKAVRWLDTDIARWVESLPLAEYPAGGYRQAA